MVKRGERYNDSKSNTLEAIILPLLHCTLEKHTTHALYINYCVFKTKQKIDEENIVYTNAKYAGWYYKQNTFLIQ